MIDKSSIELLNGNFAKPMLGAGVVDYRQAKVMIGLSGGINSMAVLSWLSNYEYKPKDIYLFYAHFDEHSPDTLPFVLAGVEYAKKHFQNVVYEQTQNSVLEYFKSIKMIPHPTIAPCTRILKIMPAIEFANKHSCTIDLVGYVKSEMRRVKNMQSNGADNLFMSKQFPIMDLSNEDCFQVVKNEIGWYPKIYDLRWNDLGFIEFVKSNLHRFNDDIQKKLLKKIETDKRVFTHNNCLPCKNMQIDDYLCVEYFYPDYFKNANDLANELKKHWGRSADDYYTSFGRQDYEVNYETQICDICAVS